ncbi:MAG: OmpH family outer membrane protein [Sedimentisphaerales bacterium]|nr:OmpH family outer membrane protein [Sedimentisphaerales bacterium]
MKRRDFVMMVFMASLTLLVIGMEYSQAAKKKDIAPPRIGIVSLKEVFDKCDMKEEVEKDLSAQGDAKFEELKQLNESIEIDKAALEKRKQTSDDYLKMLQEMMMKQSQLDAKQGFYQQELIVKEMQGKEKIYRKILEVIATVAKDKGLDIVISRDDNYLNQPDTSPPAQTPADLVMTTKTHKLFYHNPDLDITEEVLELMNKK